MNESDQITGAPQAETGTTDADSLLGFEEAMRRDFLDRTASALVASRVRELREFQSVADALGVAITRLNDVRAAIDKVNQLHAVLEARIREEIEATRDFPDRVRAGAISQDDFSVQFKGVINMLLH